MHTVPPELHQFFKNSIIFLKSRDLTLNLLNELSKKTLEGHLYCNPTAGNAGLSFATALGFKRIFAAGLDFAYSDPESHHAKDTEYFGESAKYPVKRMEHQLLVRSWNDNKIGTSVLLDNGRIGAEYLAHNNKDCRFFNLSKGAHIQGFETITLEDVNQLASMPDKEKICHAILENCEEFDSLGLSDIDVHQELQRRWRHHYIKAKGLVRSLDKFFSLPQNSIELVFDWLDLVNIELRERLEGQDVLESIIGGTTSTLQILTAAILLEVQTGQPLQQKMSFILSIWRQHLNDCMALMQDNLAKSKDQVTIDRFKPATCMLLSKSSSSNL